MIRLAVTSQWTVTIYIGRHHSGTVFFNLLCKGRDFTSRSTGGIQTNSTDPSVGIFQPASQSVKNSRNITARNRVQWQNDINRITISSLMGSDDGLLYVNLNRLWNLSIVWGSKKLGSEHSILETRHTVDCCRQVSTLRAPAEVGRFIRSSCENKVILSA